MSAEAAEVAPPPTTTLGTPASPKWDPEWLTQIDQLEQSLGHRICGAHTPAWTPCKLQSSHPNGRCRFHGGAPGIGAPNGNRNAIIHGLYSRRLQQCGDHCPLWNHCPMAGQDVLTLDPRERPHCAYEKAEYVATVRELNFHPQECPTSVIARSEAINRPAGPTKQSLPDDTPSAGSVAYETISSQPVSFGSTFSFSKEKVDLIHRNVALFQVLLSRAQAALGIARLTDETTSISRRHEMRSTKIAPLLQAQLSIARELRAWLKFLPQFNGPRGGRPTRPATPKKPDPSQGLPMRMMKILDDPQFVAGIREGLGLKPGERNPFVPDLPANPA